MIAAFTPYPASRTLTPTSGKSLPATGPARTGSTWSGRDHVGGVRITPRVRGAQHRPGLVAVEMRITPARAGSTPGPSRGQQHDRITPARTGSTLVDRAASQASGSPPRVRGAQRSPARVRVLRITPARTGSTPPGMRRWSDGRITPARTGSTLHDLRSHRLLAFHDERRIVIPPGYRQLVRVSRIRQKTARLGVICVSSDSPAVDAQ